MLDLTLYTISTCTCVQLIQSVVTRKCKIYLSKFVYYTIVELPPFLFAENHRTQSQHDDALILKLFAFQFANSYASCIYIAFFRGVSAFALCLIWITKMINVSVLFLMFELFWIVTFRCDWISYNTHNLNLFVMFSVHVHVWWVAEAEAVYR